ncbi:THUMP domain-containing protein [Paracrocinitomix mangrovi]|uniref:THUMP domain-containing class I SAM-dependent RNA methyltransferase n=1 Tax=Paracrocinitomix mangrovi TaxID=2862509 RepID=UPI001C8DA2A0|nr:THUMP domain-containing protein [Paracrocinitomix mangrovi]UKN01956.1 THUMP domain-containing protein [Paracrocinitomix mangrovi]
MKLVAKTFFGLEEVLADELKQLGAKDIEVGNRVVTYEGNKELMYKSNLWLRTAISILIPIESFKFKNEHDFKKKLSNLNFNKYMAVNKTFAVKGAVNSKEFSYTKYPMLLLKDAIVDFFNDKYGQRPSVDQKSPNILFDLHISENNCTISLNSSGAPLFQRGYRKSTGEAPLNEALAAGLIMISGWDQKSNFIDVFCGSGTLPIEAALIANGIPPQIARKQYSFMYWPDFDQQLWNQVLKSAPAVPKRDLDFKIIGSDTDPEVVKMARNNIKALPLGKTISFEIKDFKDFEAPEDGTLIINPPYGERLNDDSVFDLYKEIGDYFKNKLPGYNCWVLSSNMDAFKSLELKPSSKIRIYNANLSCDFRKYQIFKGSLIEHKYGVKK